VKVLDRDTAENILKPLEGKIEVVVLMLSIRNASKRVKVYSQI
jgi:hypothetical protein